MAIQNDDLMLVNRTGTSYTTKYSEIKTDIVDSVPSTEVSDTPPTNPLEGDLWWNTQDGRLYVWYEDANSSQWVDASPDGDSSGGGGGGTVINYNGADAWGNFKKDGTINGSFNIASVTKTATGSYDVVFTTPMPSNAYSVVLSNQSESGGNEYGYLFTKALTNSGFTITGIDANTSPDDFAISFTVHASSTVTPTYTWTRNGTTLSPANDGDDVEIGSGNIALNANGEGVFSRATGDCITAISTTNDSSNSFFGGIGNGQFNAQINTNGSFQSRTNSYGPLASDARLKENVTDAHSQWDDIKKVRFVNFNYTNAPGEPQLGLVAQELEQVCPGLIIRRPALETEVADTTNAVKAGDEILTYKHSVLVTKAVVALQEALTRIEALEAEVQQLKGGN